MQTNLELNDENSTLTPQDLANQYEEQQTTFKGWNIDKLEDKADLMKLSHCKPDAPHFSFWQSGNLILLIFRTRL
jgi:hypothetical protein